MWLVNGKPHHTVGGGIGRPREDTTESSNP